MKARFALVLVAASGAACGHHSSRLDKVEAKHSDPWSGSGATSLPSGKDDDDKGFDLQGALARIKDAVEKPGPYESPERSGDYDDTKPHWGVLAIHGGIVEKQAFSWTGGRGTELRQLAERVRALAKESQLTGLVLRVDPLDISLPDVVELRAALLDFKRTGKKLHCHAESASNATYLVLAACDTIALAPLGEIVLTGPAAMPVHVKPLLDKLGIEADFLHVGAYKGAAEPLTRDAPSNEMKETLNAILDRRYETMVDIIAGGGRLDKKAAQAAIDTALFPADEAKAAHLVDEVVPFEEFRDSTKQPWTKLHIEPEHKDSLTGWLKLARFVGAMPPEKPAGDHVALVYALGNIVDGKGEGVLGARQEIASHTMVAALRALAADDSVKAVVLRVDSGGGSAQASELIWRALQELKAKKPYVVSMSDVAASGGYYISSGANKIFALEDTLTGSIGVVGGKLALAGAAQKLGVNTFPMGRGKRATLMSSLAPWKDDEKAAIQASMESVYKVFVGRVADGRKMSADKVQPIAQGRVWTGAQAKGLGLVDEIGGLDAALAEAKRLGKVAPDSELEVYPPSPTLRDFLVSVGGVQAPLGVAMWEQELAAIDPDVAAATKHLVDLVMSFRSAQIQTVAILPVLR